MNTQPELNIGGEKPVKKPKAPKVPEPPVAEVYAAIQRIIEEREDANNLLLGATLTEWTQPPSPKRDKKIRAAFKKWMTESDVTSARLKEALKA